ncbi:MAG: heavy metal translocating P-type ATPase [Acutalibacteraceae bacterium]|nr:cadmium-translocating P-type ATPase [Clostridia bacterium]MEE1300330.1 heavy metal translocating P-type ATPase [Acutalibacteraceae bacterium]
MRRKQKKALIRIIVAAVLMIVLGLVSHFANINEYVLFALYMVPYLVVGYDVLWKAVKGIGRGQVFDENFLMAIATVGAIILQEYTEGVAVMLFYQIGELFQSIAVGKSRKNISDLMDIRPDYANIEEDGKLVQVDPDTLEPGSVIVVEPGERIPIDGVVVEGESSLNNSALTGESIPVDVGPDSPVNSGGINLSGVLKVRTTKAFGESTASKILELVENAGSRKAKAENFITKFAKYYTPAVVAAAVLLALAPPLARLAMSLDPLWTQWIYRALTFLVISCPCAIVVSVPLSFFGGIGGASNAGILIKGSNYMETLANIKTVVFDKTGTLTRGNFAVTGVHHSPYEEEELLRLAAHAESHSPHPIAKSILTAYGKELDPSLVSDVKEISGHGVTAMVDGHEVAAGNNRLMTSLDIPFHDCHSIGTIVHVAIDGEYAGHIVISDELKEHSKEAIAGLKEAGIRRTVMLTGDNEATAKQIAEYINVNEVHAGLLPADKVTIVESLLQKQDKNETLAFVGDGMNDAPVLSRADLGIAMGALGSDAAIEAADVVLMDDDPLKITKAVRIARKCMRIVKTNIWFAIGVKFACLILGALGIANMWIAIFADVGVMVLCVLNAIRCLFVKKL